MPPVETGTSFGTLLLGFLLLLVGIGVLALLGTGIILSLPQYIWRIL